MSVCWPLQPEQVPELKAHQATIVRASQYYARLAWVRYDLAFCQQAALTGLRGSQLAVLSGDRGQNTYVREATASV